MCTVADNSQCLAWSGGMQFVQGFCARWQHFNMRLAVRGAERMPGWMRSASPCQSAMQGTQTSKCTLCASHLKPGQPLTSSKLRSAASAAPRKASSRARAARASPAAAAARRRSAFRLDPAWWSACRSAPGLAAAGEAQAGAPATHGCGYKVKDYMSASRKKNVHAATRGVLAALLRLTALRACSSQRQCPAAAPLRAFSAPITRRPLSSPMRLPSPCHTPSGWTGV